MSSLTGLINRVLTAPEGWQSSSVLPLMYRTAPAKPVMGTDESGKVQAFTEPVYAFGLPGAISEPIKSVTIPAEQLDQGQTPQVEDVTPFVVNLALASLGVRARGDVMTSAGAKPPPDGISPNRRQFLQGMASTGAAAIAKPKVGPFIKALTAAPKEAAATIHPALESLWEDVHEGRLLHDADSGWASLPENLGEVHHFHANALKNAASPEEALAHQEVLDKVKDLHDFHARTADDVDLEEDGLPTDNIAAESDKLVDEIKASSHRASQLMQPGAVEKALPEQPGETNVQRVLRKLEYTPSQEDVFEYSPEDLQDRYGLDAGEAQELYDKLAMPSDTWNANLQAFNGRMDTINDASWEKKGYVKVGDSWYPPDHPALNPPRIGGEKSTDKLGAERFNDKGKADPQGSYAKTPLDQAHGQEVRQDNSNLTKTVAEAYGSHQTIPASELSTLQNTVNVDRVKSFMDNPDQTPEPGNDGGTQVLAFRSGDRIIVSAGNHRAAAAKLQGGEIEAFIVDMNQANADARALAANNPGVTAGHGYWLNQAAAEKIKPPTPIIEAFHGSPHKFDQFDINKIGTGEGAAAYGHGLYFAQNEKTALDYHRKFGKQQKRVDHFAAGSDENLSNWGELHELLDRSKYAGDPKTSWDLSNAILGNTASDYNNAAIAHIDTLIADLNKEINRIDPKDRLHPEFRSYVNALTELQGLKERGHTFVGTKSAPENASMYQVAIQADPEHFLDWDKEISQHPEWIQRVLENHLDAPVDEEATFGDLHEMMTDKEYYPEELGDEVLTKEMIAEKLRKAGIPGIKYLDQGSRNLEPQSERTYNYVIFDPKIIKILKRYGIPAGVATGALKKKDDQ